MSTPEPVGLVTTLASAPNLKGASSTIRMNGADNAKNSHNEVVDTTLTPAIFSSAQATMEVTIEAVQLFGGNGYMAEYQVEQLCRDAKVLQIYGGTDEIQISQIARNLLGAT